MPQVPWTEAEKAILRDTINDGLPYSHVAERLGRSRNSCIGMGRRMGITPPNKTAAPAPAPPPKPKKPRFIPCDGLPLVDLDAGDCRYPIGQDDKGRHLFCGAATGSTARAWCAQHHHVVYEKGSAKTPPKIVATW